MIKLDVKQVLKYHEIMISKTGGEDGLRDYGLLVSSVESIYQTFDQVELYPTITEKAARLGFGIVCNHPFVDGNKRTGLFVMLIFLESNGIFLDFTQGELVDLGLGLADGSIGYSEVVKWIEDKRI